VRQSGKGLVATLVSSVDLPFVPDDLERQRKGVYEQRTEVGREVTRLESQLGAFADPDPDLPEVEESAASLIAEADAAREHNARIDRAVDEVSRQQLLIEQMKRNLAEAQRALDAATEQEAYARTQLDKMSERIDVSAITDRLQQLDTINRRIRAAQERAAVAERLSEVKAKQAQHTIKLKQIEKEKADALAAVEFPVPGLSFDDSGVTLNGIPLSQASSAEQLRVSVALAMAANPKLRVLRIMDGSLLDSESMQIIADLAVEHDYQVWVEVVDESGKVGVVIEDGQVAR
jgi:hypothetical protein